MRRVQDFMTTNVQVCSPETDLAAAAELMWNNDCGALPVVENGKLQAMITDRDICIALGTRDRRPSELRVNEVANSAPEACEAGADIHSAMAKMRRAHVRRLPVVNEAGEIQGIVTLNDLILAADRKHGALEYEEVLNTAKAVCEHRSHNAPAQVAAIA